MAKIAKTGAAVGIFLWVCISPVIADVCPGSFAHEIVSSDRLSRMVEKALLYINDGDARGTAFLIDRDRGLYLTAAHVVMNKADYSIKENRDTVFLLSRNPKLSSDRIRLKVLSVLSDEQDFHSAIPDFARDDLAILEIRDFVVPENVQPLELALRMPGRNPRERVRFTGFGVARPEIPPSPRIIDDDTWTLDLLSDDSNVYRIGASVEGGDSGGPILLGNGNVIGFILRQQGREQAIVHPLVRYHRVIMEEASEEGSGFIEALFSSEDINERKERAVELLEPGPGALSNLELAAAILKLAKMERLAELEAELLECPLYVAAEQRQIGAFGGPIENEWVRREYAAAEPATILNEAVRAEQGGEMLRALALYDLARDGYRKQLATLVAEEAPQRALAGSLTRAFESVSPGETAGELGASSNFQDTLAKLAVRLNTPLLVDTMIEVTDQTAYRFRTYTSDRLSVALNDYGRALARGNDLRSQLIGADAVDPSSQEVAIRATAIGAAVAGNPTWRQINLDTLQYSLTGLDGTDAGVEIRALAETPDDRLLLELGIGDALELGESDG